MRAMDAQTESAGFDRPYDLPPQLEREILQYARACGLRRVVLYGSRARGTNHPRSDIDLAVSGGDTLCFMLEASENLDTLLMLDVVDLADPLDPEFRNNILREGIVLADSTQQFARALANLCHVMDIVEKSSADPVMELAALVHLFVTCFEQSWRAMKAVLEEQGYPQAASGSPRQIIQLSYRAGITDDEAGWLRMLKARRLAAHTYNESTAQAVVDSLPEFAALFRALESKLRRLD